MAENQSIRSDEWLLRESMGDARLLRLISAREQILKNGIVLLHQGELIPDALREELNDVGWQITERKVKLDDLQRQSDGDENYFHLLVTADDLREEAEGHPDNSEVKIRWQEARQAVDEYRDRLELGTEPRP